MEQNKRKFTYRNESFTCVNCGFSVLPAQKSCRNHCPNCLHSVHLDVFPGDRSANCGGEMIPIAIESHSKKGQQIVHRCTKCGYECRNVLNLDDPIQPDNMNAAVAVMKESSIKRL